MFLVRNVQVSNITRKPVLWMLWFVLVSSLCSVHSWNIHDITCYCTYDVLFFYLIKVFVIHRYEFLLSWPMVLIFWTLIVIITSTTVKLLKKPCVSWWILLMERRRAMFNSPKDLMGLICTIDMLTETLSSSTYVFFLFCLSKTPH